MNILTANAPSIYIPNAGKNIKTAALPYLGKLGVPRQKQSNFKAPLRRGLFNAWRFFRSVYLLRYKYVHKS